MMAAGTGAGLAPNPLVNKRKKIPAGGFMVSSAQTGGGLFSQGSATRPPGFGPPPPGYGGSYGPQLPTNRTAVNSGLHGQGSQETDQMGRVITQTGSPGATDMFGNPIAASGGTMIEDPYQTRLSQDFTDYKNRRLFDKELERPPQQMESEGEISLANILDMLDDKGSAPRESPMATPGRVTGEPEADRRAAESAEFGRAKDRVAKIARGAGKGLEADMVGRGLVGSGIEARNMRDIVRGGQGDLANVATEQAMASLSRRNAVADRNYAGDIGQRGQDIGVGSTNLGAGVTQRGQDLDAQRSLLSILPTIIGKKRLVLR